MQRFASPLMVFGVMATSVAAGDMMPYPRPAPVGMSQTYGGCGPSCGGAAVQGESNRFSKLIDFLTYRPIGPCQCPPEPSYYVPPLHSWFPNCCHANAGRGRNHSGCGSAGCASCGATLGSPTVVAAASREKTVVPPMAIIPARPNTMSSARPMVAASKPVLKPLAPTRGSFTPPANASYSQQPKPAVANYPGTGFRVQPTGYNLPQR